MLLPDEVAEEYELTGYEVLTPGGWRSVTKVYKTVPMAVWRLRTKNYSLLCSGGHIVKGTHGWIAVRDASPGSEVITESGPEEVIECAPTGETKELFDITVDDPSGEFFSDGILSHNSTTFCVRQIVMSQLFPGYRGLYVAPSHPMLETYASRLLEMESYFRGSLGNQNKYSKRYNNRSMIDLAYCLETARDCRGKSVDECLIDECVSYDTTLLRRGDRSSSDIPTRICDIEVGDYVVSFTDEGSKTYDRVVAKQCKGVRECCLLRTESGRSVRATCNHRVFTNQGKLYVSEVRDRVCTHEKFCTGGHASGDGSEDTCAPETSRVFCVPGRGLSEEKDGKSSCKIACEEEGGKAIRYEEVVEVVPCGAVPVYDITTERTHRFLANSILVSNCQNLNADLLPEILYTQTTSKIPMTIYAGTALSTETLLELRWRESSMGMWHIRAMDGKHWLNMYDRETLYKVCNSPIGPVCPYTGKKLDVTNGCYVHANKQALEDGNMGIHVPQCIIKDIADDPLQWAKVYRHIQEDDFKKVLQECFGIAVAEGSREITVTDLQAICTLQLDPADIIERCKRGYYKMIISGCDWGGSDYVPAQKSKKSYTVHCIIGLAPDGIVDILHYRQYSGMGYPEIAAQIIADHRAHFGKALASDFGVGMAYNNELRKYMPIDRHFVMGYTAPDTKALAVPKGDHYPNQLSLNRTESLTNTFRDLKQRKIRARLWEHSGKYLLDWLNMCRIPTETANGRKTFLYRRPPEKSDDALHAFNFAYALMKFYKGESLVEDPAVTKAINAALYAATPMQQAMVRHIQQKIAGNTQWVISG